MIGEFPFFLDSCTYSSLTLALCCRSPSPAPQYDNHGRRINTREYRYRKRLEEERHKLIEKAMKLIPNYHPPQDYRRPTKTQEKVYVPVNDYPEINFSMIANPLTLLTKLVFLVLFFSCPDWSRPSLSRISHMPCQDWPCKDRILPPCSHS